MTYPVPAFGVEVWMTHTGMTWPIHGCDTIHSYSIIGRVGEVDQVANTTQRTHIHHTYYDIPIYIAWCLPVVMQWQTPHDEPIFITHILSLTWCSGKHRTTHAHSYLSPMVWRTHVNGVMFATGNPLANTTQYTSPILCRDVIKLHDALIYITHVTTQPYIWCGVWNW